MIASQVDERVELIQAIEKRRDSKVVIYVTGDRPGLETQISPEAVDIFVDHLDNLWPSGRISLFLYTRGGNTAAAWRLINLVQTFCDELEVIVPSTAMSAGTLICLGANRIIMTKQGALGPIDPSLTNPLNPLIPGSNQRAQVSVEAVQGYLDIAKSQFNITEQSALATILTQLSQQIHPLVLGHVFRSRAQIRELATKLLKHQSYGDDEIEKIVAFLCSESGSHDHTLNRREARQLGLKIENPCDELYKEINALYKHFSRSLSLRDPFRPDTVLGGDTEKEYILPRAIIETVSGGSHQFMSEGKITSVTVNQPNGMTTNGIQDNRTFEGWRRIK